MASLLLYRFPIGLEDVTPEKARQVAEDNPRLVQLADLVELPGSIDQNMSDLRNGKYVGTEFAEELKMDIAAGVTYIVVTDKNGKEPVQGAPVKNLKI